MGKPIQKILIYLQENMNGIGIIMNESGLSAREKTYYTAVNDSLKTTKEYVESFLNDEEELLRQNKEMRKALEKISKIANDRYMEATTRLSLIDSRCENCLTSCNKGKE